MLEIASYEKYLLCNELGKKQLNSKNDFIDAKEISTDFNETTLNGFTERNIIHHSNKNALRFLVDKMYLLKSFAQPIIIPYSVYIK